MAETTEMQDQRNQRNLERLVRSIESSFGKLNVLIAVCDDPHYRDAVIHTYEESLQEFEIVCCRGTIDRIHPNLTDTLLNLYTTQPKPLSPTVVTLVGADELLAIRMDGLKSSQEEFFFSAQWSKEGLVTFGVPIVLWVSSQVAAGLERNAQDFWNGRGGVFKFVPPLSPGQTEADQRDMEWAIADCEREINNQGPSETVESAQSLHELAALYESIDRYELALPLYERVLKINRAELGDRHPDTITALNALASLCELTERYESALALYELRLEIVIAEVGDRHLDTATCLNSLAYVYRLMGEYALALPLYEQALTIRRAALGDRHESTATSLNNLAGLSMSMGEYALALPLYEEAVVMFEQVLGRSHSSTEVVRGNLRSLKARMKK